MKNSLQHIEFAAQTTFSAVDDGEDSARPEFEIVAYTGVPMNVGFSDPVILALDGIEFSEKIPLRRNHDSSRVIGHTLNISAEDQGIVARGAISFENEDASEIISSAKNGFPWQASIGATILDERKVLAGKSVEVNGKTFDGPLRLITASRIDEISFVDLGADRATSASLAASDQGDNTMDERLVALSKRLGLELTEDVEQALGALSAEAVEEILAKNPEPDSDAEPGDDLGEDDEMLAVHRRIRSLAAADPRLADEATALILEGVSFEAARERLREFWGKLQEGTGTPEPGNSEDAVAVPDTKTMAAMVSNLSQF